MSYHVLNGKLSNDVDTHTNVKQLVLDEFSVASTLHVAELQQGGNVPLEVSDVRVVVARAHRNNLFEQLVFVAAVSVVQVLNQLLDDQAQVLLGDHGGQEVQSTHADSHVFVLQAGNYDVTMLSDTLREYAHDIVHGEQTQVLQVGIRVLDKSAQLANAQTHDLFVLTQATDAGLNDFEEQRHGGCSVDEGGEGLNQLLGQARLVRRKQSELDAKA